MRIGHAGLALTIALGACVPTRPGSPTPVQAAAVAASFGRTWDATIDVFAQRSIPIRNMERASGLIVAEVASVGSDGSKYADCGSDGIMARTPSSAFYNVVVRGDSSQSTVRVTAKWMVGAIGLECATKAVWETQLEDAIKQRAESSATAVK